MSSPEIFSLLQTIASRLSVIEDSLGIKNDASTSGKSDVVKLPRSITAFDSYFKTYVTAFVDASVKLGGDAEQAGNLTKEAFTELRNFLLLASACKEPPQAGLAPLLTDLAGKMKAIGGLVQRNVWEKHTKTVSEGLGCLNWVCVKPAPCDFIETFIGGSDYWANGIRKEYRTTNLDQMAFCDTFKAIIKELIAYVKEYHTTGVSWNAKGIDVSQYNPNETAAAAVVVTPTPPAAATAVADVAKPAPSTSTPPPAVDLFSAINKGGQITAGLKTVTRDQQTWRAEYKATADVPVPAAAAPSAKAKSVRVVDTPKGPPKLEYQDLPHKWVVEYQTADGGVVSIQIKELRDTVYIFGCIGATIDVSGKCKSVIIDSCKKCKVYYDNVMASCEVVNCQRMHVECREKVSSVAIDKTDGIVVQLPRSSLDSTIVASKSSEMNVTWPDEAGELIERPIPEQYIHRISGTSITADVSDLYGH